MKTAKGKKKVTFHFFIGKAKSQKQEELEIFHLLLHSSNATSTTAGPSQDADSETPLESCMWRIRTQVFEPLSTAFPGTLTELAEYPEYKPFWPQESHSGISSATHLVIQPAPASHPHFSFPLTNPLSEQAFGKVDKLTLGTPASHFRMTFCQCTPWEAGAAG